MSFCRFHGFWLKIIKNCFEEIFKIADPLKLILVKFLIFFTEKKDI